jgi:hypothetical protein
MRDAIIEELLELCFLCDPYRDTISSNISEGYLVQYSAGKWRLVWRFGELVGEMQFSHCELLVLEAGSWGKGIVREPRSGTSAVGSRYQSTTGEDTADWEDFLRVVVIAECVY